MLKKIVISIMALFSLSASATDDSAISKKILQEGNFVHLDAEELAETGMKKAYDNLIPALQEFIPSTASLTELIDNNAGTYAVQSGGVTYPIIPEQHKHSPQVDSWGNATYAFFDIVNRQLASSPYKFYALNSGNDLTGIFLTQRQYQALINSWKKKTDWPYLPSLEAEWYGQPH